MRGGFLLFHKVGNAIFGLARKFIQAVEFGAGGFEFALGFLIDETWSCALAKEHLLALVSFFGALKLIARAVGFSPRTGGFEACRDDAIFDGADFFLCVLGGTGGFLLCCLKPLVSNAREQLAFEHLLADIRPQGVDGAADRGPDRNHFLGLDFS